MGQRILVVDDSEDLRDLYVAILQAAGYEVSTAADGSEGFVKVRTQRPDLVVCDVVMPHMDGFELLEKLRSDLAPPIPPVILCSGFDITEGEALRRGAVSFLGKPFDREDLLAYVRHGLRAAQPSHEVAERGRRHAQRARRCTREIAAALVSSLEAEARAPQQTLAQIATAPLEWLRGYFGFDQADLFLVEGSNLQLVAHAGSDDLRPLLDGESDVRAFHDVVESASTLVVADLVAHPLFAPINRVFVHARHFAGVPLLVEHATPIGMICVAGAARRQLAPEDLAILQLVAHRASMLLGTSAPHDGPDVPARFGAGVLVAEMVQRLLTLELRQLERDGGSLALALVDDIEDIDPAVIVTALARAPRRERLAAGILAGGRAAIFRRDDEGRAAPRLDATVSAVTESSGVGCAVGVVELTGAAVPNFDGVDLIRVGELALARAIDDGSGRVKIEIAVHNQPDEGEPDARPPAP